MNSNIKNSNQQHDIISVWNKVAETYSDISVSFNAEYAANYKVLIDSVGAIKGKYFCEVGCGSGILSAHLAQNGARTMLVDIAPEALLFAKKNYKFMGVHGDFCIQNALQMGFRDDSFDVVWNDGVIEHFTDNGKIALIKEMWRVLRPGGVLLIRVPHAFDLPFRLAKFIAQRRGTWQFGYEDDLSVQRFKEIVSKANVHNAEYFVYNPIVGWWFLPRGKSITDKLKLNSEKWHMKRNIFGHVLVLLAKKPT